MNVNHTDRETLQRLADEVASIAALPAQAETVKLWKALNGLRPKRPMIMIDQLPWHELNVGDELTPVCTDAFCRRLETGLRQTLYAWRHLRADMVVPPFLAIPKTIRNSGFGIAIREDVAVSDPTNSVVGHLYHDQLEDETSIDRIRDPEISLDAAATACEEETARAIFDDILPVRMEGRCPQFAPWDLIVTWRGAEAVLLDLAVRPDYMHRLIARMMDAGLAMLDQLEQQGLLGYDPQRIHCTGAFTDELPAPGFDPARPRAIDLWTNSQPQIFASVSREMHKAFDIDYIRRWYSRFGLGYYGCCEPLDTKVDLIATLPRIRKISMSPWVDVERGAAAIGTRHVFSRKPNPAFLTGVWNPKRVEEDLVATREACRRHGCPLEFILKDVSTVAYEPQRLWEWSQIAMRVATSTA